MKIIGIIPARLGSTRLQEKVLKPMAGKPMIQHVWERVHQAKKLNEIWVACDDTRIVQCVEGFGGKARMTRPEHPNGSSRVAEVARDTQGDIFINIQGDEPTIHPAAIDALAEAFLQEPAIQVATLAVQRDHRDEYENPNVVKVVCDRKGNALYFSRSPIPYFREAASPKSFLKHLGIYGYQKDFLLKYVTWPSGILENYEKLEQLRILEQGIELRVVETPYDSWSVDTLQDLEFVESKLKQSQGKH